MTRLTIVANSAHKLYDALSIFEIKTACNLRTQTNFLIFHRIVSIGVLKKNYLIVVLCSKAGNFLINETLYKEAVSNPFKQ